MVVMNVVYFDSCVKWEEARYYASIEEAKIQALYHLIIACAQTEKWCKQGDKVRKLKRGEGGWLAEYRVASLVQH